MAQFLGILFNAFIVLFFFSFTIFVHEFGHFWVARKLGFKVLEFSIGFGAAIWKRTINGVVYKFAIIPLGGYVKLPQMDPTGLSLSDEDKKNPLPVMEPWKRIAVGLAGVTCNMILAVVLAWIVYLTGRPAEFRDLGTQVDFIETNSVLYAKGLRAGDRIEVVNEHRVRNWDQVMTLAALDPDVTLQVRRDGKPFEIHFRTSTVQEGVALFWRDMEPVSPAIIGLMFTNWPAYAAGLRTGDRIVSIDGAKIAGKSHMISVVSKSEGRPLHIEFERAGARQTVAVTPRYDEELKRHRIGNAFQAETVYPRPVDEIRYAAGAVGRLLQKLTTPANSGRAFEAIGGAPEIFYAFWHMTRAGIINAISFSVTLNVNLSILNLLPFFVLDGGHICLALWEWFWRRPANKRVVAALWQTAAACLITLMLFLTLRGFYRIHKWTSAPDEMGQASSRSVPAEEPVSAKP